MSLKDDLQILITDAKGQPEMDYVMWAGVDDKEYLIGQTKLGPTVDVGRMSDALLRAFETNLSKVPLTPIQIAGSEAFLVEKFDAAAAITALLQELEIPKGDLYLVDNATWLMLIAQGCQPTPLNASDWEISFKGRSLRRSVAL